MESFFTGNSSAEAKALTKEPMIWWAIIAGNLVCGLLLAYIFGKWALFSGLKLVESRKSEVQNRKRS